MVDGEPATDSEGNLYTNNVGSYSIITGYTPSGAQWSSTENPNNYEVTSAPVGLIRINPADLTVNVGNATTVYGTPFDTSKYTYSYENLVNGDTAAVVDADLKMSPKYTNTGDGTDGRATQDVGDYSLTIKPSSFNSYLKTIMSRTFCLEYLQSRGHRIQSRLVILRQRMAITRLFSQNSRRIQ